MVSTAGNASVLKIESPSQLWTNIASRAEKIEMTRVRDQSVLTVTVTYGHGVLHGE